MIVFTNGNGKRQIAHHCRIDRNGFARQRQQITHCKAQRIARVDDRVRQHIPQQYVRCGQRARIRTVIL